MLFRSEMRVAVFLGGGERIRGALLGWAADFAGWRTPWFFHPPSNDDTMRIPLLVLGFALSLPVSASQEGQSVPEDRFGYLDGERWQPLEVDRSEEGGVGKGCGFWGSRYI